MRNLVVHCNPHTRTHTYAGEKFKCFLCPRKDHPAKKIFQEQYTIQRETCRFFILSSRSPRETRQNEKGSTLCDYDLSLSLSLFLVSTECKIVEHEGGRKGRVSGRLAGHAQQSGTDLWRKLLCLGPPERESRYPTFPCI